MTICDNDSTQNLGNTRARSHSEGVESRPQGAIGGGRQAGGEAPLGNYPKSVDRDDAPQAGPQALHACQQDGVTIENQNEKLVSFQRQRSRRLLYADLKIASDIIRTSVRHDHAVAKCKWCPTSKEIALNTRVFPARRGSDEGPSIAASWSGLKTCSNVWGCPVCGARISRVRRAELDHMLKWARAEKIVPVLLTLTARHGRKDRLDALLDGMKEAKRRLRQRAEWRGLEFAGSVTATEITYGARNGWHPHFHEIVLLRAESEAAAIRMMKGLKKPWIASLKGQGLSGAAAAFDVRGASEAGNYIAKWGVAAELTLTAEKEGKKGKVVGNRTPQQLLRASPEEPSARAAWLEYFHATSGKRRRQLSWSPGLRAACGLGREDDTDRLGEGEEEAPGDPQTVFTCTSREWTDRGYRLRRLGIMEAAERGEDPIQAATIGPIDEELPSPESACIPVLDDRDTAELPAAGPVGILREIDLGEDDERLIDCDYADDFYDHDPNGAQPVGPRRSVSLEDDDVDLTDGVDFVDRDDDFDDWRTPVGDPVAAGSPCEDDGVADDEPHLSNLIHELVAYAGVENSKFQFETRPP